MSQARSSNSESRKRVLLLAHSFDAGRSMESRLSWFRAVQAAQQHEVTVISAIANLTGMENLSASERQNLRVVTLEHNRVENLLKRFPVFFYLAYRMWQRRVLRLAKQLHADQPFDLVHQVSYCGYREPGECWRLDAPFVWGPIGGTQNFPNRFLLELSPVGMLQESLRNCVNFLQLKFSSRVRRALAASACVISANREVQQALKHYYRCDSKCQLETGLPTGEGQRLENRDPDQPLRILWAGRLESWKALPLLLKAVAKLPQDVRYELRIVGGGSNEQRWKNLTEQLGLQDHVDWAGWPIYEQRSEHYQWADLFVFTSLRDTSGTGLLEALAAGVPIVGVDHQGARDIMTDGCALKITPDSSQSVIRQISEAITTLAGDPHLLARLSQGALQRSTDYHWDNLAVEMMDIYERAMRMNEVNERGQLCPEGQEVSYTRSAGDSTAENTLAMTTSAID